MRHPILLSVIVCSVGCKSEGAAYVFLPELCNAYAEDICAARQRADCACAYVSPNCQREVHAACEDLRAELVQDARLTYNADTATDVRASLVRSLDRCEDPFRVSAFFSGGVPLGEACARDLDCASGACALAEDDEGGTCVDAAAFPLCEPAPEEAPSDE